MRRNSKPFVKREEEAQHRINDKISAQEIRLVNEGEEPKVLTLAAALEMAEAQDMDLVEISPNAKPPVCKIMDYKKFLYNQKRKQKELKAKQSKIVVKEIRFGPNTDDLVGPGGLFTYQTTFDLSGLDHTTASILGRWATDDQGIDILINGTATGNTSASFGVFTDFTINSGFIAGVNTLDFVVTNGHGPTGLRVEITNANAVALDEPYALALLGLGLLGLGINRHKKT